jgi:hypothetical protein
MSARPKDEDTKVTRSIYFSAAAFAVFVLATTANALAADSRAGRYTMHKSNDGFVRLDTETGAVALCQKTDAGWGCKDMAGSNAGLRSEIERLTRENAELKAEVKRMEELVGLRGERDDSKHKFTLPSEQDVDNALDYFERMIRKFQDRLKRLERKSEEPERQL